MKLPTSDRVVIDERKVRDYLLSQSHPVGRFKARYFAALGFDQDQADAFILEVRRIAAEGEVLETQDTAFGRKYTVRGVLRGPGGSVPVFTVWIQERGQQDVRLVTVRPV